MVEARLGANLGSTIHVMVLAIALSGGNAALATGRVLRTVAPPTYAAQDSTPRVLGGAALAQGAGQSPDERGTPEPAHITIGGPAPYAHIGVGANPSLASVTVSRAADAMGAPVDFSRFRAWSSSSLPAGLPLAASTMSSRFGMRTHPILGGRRAHQGVDLAAPTGTPVFATSDGTVSRAQWQGGYGLFLELAHGNGVQTRYGHMSRLNVASGQRVRKGDLIGFVGSTGRSTGPHLHYEMRVNGRPVNPLPHK